MISFEDDPVKMRRLKSLWMFVMVLPVLFVTGVPTCFILFGFWDDYRRYAGIERADVIAVFVYDCPLFREPYSDGVHTLTFGEDGTYDYHWKSDFGDAESNRTGTWTFSHYGWKASVYLEEFMFEGNPGPGREADDETYVRGFPVVRSPNGTLQLLLGEHPDYQFNKQ
jgi:hypothetical protein